MPRILYARGPALFLGLVLALAVAAGADEKRYTEGRHGPATLHYVEHIPVLKLYGSPAEMGEQAGRLIGNPAARCVREYLGKGLVGPLRGLVLKQARRMEPHMPADYRAEMKAFAEASPLSLEEMLILNTFADVKKVISCTTIAVSGARSKEGTPLLGRNFDFPSLGIAEHYGIVVVYHPTGKKAFASISHPGLIGTHSFLNAAGLAGAVMEVLGGDPRFSPEAMPALMLYRTIAESTGAVERALEIVKAGPRCSSNNLILVEAGGRAALAEFTVSRFAVRRPTDGLLFGTNHHRAPGMRKLPYLCPRMKYLLDQAGPDGDPDWNVDSVKAHLRKTALGRLNLYSMVILPEKRAFHLAAGKIPAAKERFVFFDRKPLFGPPLRRRRL